MSFGDGPGPWPVPVAFACLSPIVRKWHGFRGRAAPERLPSRYSIVCDEELKRAQEMVCDWPPASTVRW